MNKRDYYEVLGVSKDASDKDIKSAFRKLSMKYHPDKQVGKTEEEKKEATSKFQEIAEAYEVLSDKDKRSNYDQFGFDSPGSNGFGGFDMGDFMRRHGGMFSSFFGGGNPFDDNGFGFGGMGNMQRPQVDPSAPEDGRDVRLRVSLPFKDAIFGKTREFDINLDEECPKCHGKGIKDGSEVKKCTKCNGTGVVTERIQHGFMISLTSSPCSCCNGTGYIYEKCEHCHGEKRVSKNKHVSVNIPAGIEAGLSLRVKGYGCCGTCGGQNGDLYIQIGNIEKSDVFERQGLNLKIKVPISPIVASIGGKVEVLSPYGMENMKIPAGTFSGQTFRENGKGIKSRNGIGDLIVEVFIEPFSNLSDSQKEVIEKLQEIVNEDNFKKAKEMRMKATSFLNDK